MGRKGLSPVMVGRQAELTRLAGLLPSGGEPEVALVAGEAGVGKTRLTAELIASLPEGTVVLTAGAGQGGLGRPFQLLLDAVEPVVSGWVDVPPELAASEDPACLLLAPVAPNLTPCADRDYGREELVRTAVDVVRYLVGAGPAVVVFDDLHWADPESVALFGRLATTAGLPALLVGSYRPEDLHRSHPLAELMAALERRRTVCHLTLGRLTQHDVADLLAAVYDQQVPFTAVEALHRRTGGNPFFVEELLLAAGQTEPELLASLPLPWNLTEAVLRHVDELTPEQRSVVDAAAVLGQRITFDLLAALTGLTEGDLIDALRQLVHAGGLLVEEEPDVFAFRHALTREAVVGQLLGRERRRLHEKALAAMQEAGSDDWMALAHHAEGAARYDEMVDAARSGAARSLRQGSTFQALRLAELGLTEAEDDIDLLRLAAEAAWSVGLLDAARRHAERWRRVAAQQRTISGRGPDGLTPGGTDDLDPQPVRLRRPAEANLAEALDGPERTMSVADESAALRLLSRIHWERGDSERQWETVRAAEALAEPLGPSAELAAAYVLHAEASMLHRQSDDALAWADRALAMIDEVGATELRPRALVNKGSALTDFPGRGEEGAALLEQAITEALAIGDVFNHSRALTNLLGYRMGEWPFERSHEVLDQARTLSERAGRSGSPVSVWATFSAELGTLEGDMEAIRSCLAEGRRRDPSALAGGERLWYVAFEVDLALEAGDVATAGQLLADNPPAALAHPNQSATWWHALAAELAAREGRLDDAAAELGTAVELVVPHTAEWVRRALIAGVRAGLPKETARRLAAAIPPSGRCTDAHSPAWSDQLEGALAEADADIETAAAAYQRALESPRHRPAALVADTRFGLARCRLALGDIGGARQQTEAAVALLARWPGWRRDEIEAFHRRLTRATAVTTGALTSREQEVAGLVAAGLTNGEIARQLYISTKTASVHVSNILMKLGLSSRTELAAWYVRLQTQQ